MDEFRPVLIVGNPFIAAGFSLQYALMITSAANPRWPDDIALIDDHLACGLRRPSLIRVAKIASVETGKAVLIGTLPASKLSAVERVMNRSLTR